MRRTQLVRQLTLDDVPQGDRGGDSRFKQTAQRANGNQHQAFFLRAPPVLDLNDHFVCDVVNRIGQVVAQFRFPQRPDGGRFVQADKQLF